jgi:hypothetical protein
VFRAAAQHRQRLLDPQRAGLVGYLGFRREIRDAA